MSTTDKAIISYVTAKRKVAGGVPTVPVKAGVKTISGIKNPKKV